MVLLILHDQESIIIKTVLNNNDYRHTKYQLFGIASFYER